MKIEKERPDMPPPPTPATEVSDRIVSLPLSADKWVNLRGPFPMTETEWTLMKAVLEAMKPGLVKPETKSDDSGTQESH